MAKLSKNRFYFLVRIAINSFVNFTVVVFTAYSVAANLENGCTIAYLELLED